MSQAFVRENDEMQLNDVAPSVTALMIFLTRENNGIRVYSKHSVKHPAVKGEVYVMSNGLSYAKNEASKWYRIN
jgi:hypothetical protein